MTLKDIDPTDARLLDILQADFPIVSRPFEAIAWRLNVPALEVIERTKTLKSVRIIRQISAIFDSRALGYSSTLVTFKVAPHNLDSVAESVSSHAGVSHCYSRNDEYNLWFTITVGPDKNVADEVEPLAHAESVASYILLPSMRLFKIGVFFGMSDTLPEPRLFVSRGVETEAAPLSKSQIAAVRALQKDIPIVDLPFAELASQTNMDESTLLEFADQFLKSGKMRRFAAVLRHQKAGYGANAMVCWRVEDQQVIRIGEVMAEHAAVSHCYQRPTTGDWPYALYTMIHARTEDEISRIISELCASSGARDYKILRTIKEYKKSRVVYFE